MRRAITILYESIGAIDKFRTDVIWDTTGERNDFCRCPETI